MRTTARKDCSRTSTRRLYDYSGSERENRREDGVRGFGIAISVFLVRAVKQISAANKSVCVQVSGYLLEELRNEDNLNQFKEDVENANVFIGSLIFIEELAEKIVDIVAPVERLFGRVRDLPVHAGGHAIEQVGYVFHGAVGSVKSAIASFMRKKKESGGFEEGMLKLVRTLQGFEVFAER